MSKKEVKSGYILVIVESPTKILKLQPVLGDKYLVTASAGHIIDLEKGKMSIDIANNFEPQYTIIQGKEKIVQSLKQLMKNASDIILATDLDREGEMISWSLARELNLEKLNIKDPKRIVFDSITKEVIEKAMKNPLKINNNLVDAQKMRRLLDRIIGYKISPLLWKNIGGSLSAGRVQSVIVKLIVEKEQSIMDFFKKDSVSNFKIDGNFLNKKHNSFSAILYSNKKDNDEEENNTSKGSIAKIDNVEDAKKIMIQISESTFKISDVSERDSLRNPSPPFTTATLQQEASRKYGFAPKRTMMAAQHLYEAGHITYMRTDSVNLSEEALKNIEKYVKEKHGDEYYKRNQYKSKCNTQEAHEAIRPTYAKVTGISKDDKFKISSDEIKLYVLIWKRAISSQMSPAKIKITTTRINISKTNKFYFVSQTENILFYGYLAVYNMKNLDNEEEDEEIKSVVLEKGDIVTVENVKAVQVYEKPPTRYDDASLVNQLSENNLNIGRPATTASLIEKIQSVGYVVKKDNEGNERNSIVIKLDSKNKISEHIEKILLGGDKNKFSPTSLGIIVTDFLEKNFADIMDYKFTSDMETKLDEIAEGKLEWKKVLEQFYEKFNPLVENIEKNSKNKEFIDKNSREIGVHPETKEKIYATVSKYGPIVKMQEGKKFLCAPIKEPLTLETITLEQALELYKFPKTLGKYNRKNVTLNRGQYGYYLKLGKEKVAIKSKDDEELDINKFDIEDAKKILDENDKKYLWKGSDDKNKYVVLSGQYGKYIQATPIGKTKGSNYKLPDDENVENLTIEKVHEIIKNKYSKGYTKKFVKKNKK